MIEKLKGCLLDIYSIMDREGVYVRTIDDDYLIKYEEFENKNKPNDIVLIDDHRKNSKGEYGVYSWTTYTNIANSIAKFLLANTSFLDDCGYLAMKRYNLPHTYFKFDVEYDYEQELTRLIKDYFYRDLENIVYSCNCLFNVVNFQVEIDVTALERIYDFINMYRALVFLFDEYLLAGNTHKDGTFLIGANDHGNLFNWMRNPLKMNYETEWF